MALMRIPRGGAREIATKVKAALSHDASVNGQDIKVETFKGNVQLSGFADSLTEIERAARLARDVPGVKSVHNGIRLKNRRPR